jgi:cytidylate kinase
MKIYLDASAEARARRRFREVLSKGWAARYSDVLRAIRERDEFDANRSAAPLTVPPDAVVVNTDYCTVEQVIGHLVSLANQWPDSLTTDGGESPCRPPT